MTMAWYFKNGEQILGPLEPQELKQAVSQGVITATTQVRKGKDGAWFAASQVSGLLTPPPSISSGTFNAQEFAGQVFQTGKPYARALGEKAGFFDFGFTKFLTPVILKIFWVIDVIFACLAPFVVLLVSLFSVPAGYGVSLGEQLMVAIISFLLCAVCCILYLLVMRVLHESIIVIFKIENHLRKE